MGYLLIDNRESYGVKEEYDTLACKHCGGLVLVYKGPTAKLHEQYWCWRHDGPYCVDCGRLSNGVCWNYIDQKLALRTQQEAARIWRQIAGLDGPIPGDSRCLADYSRS